MIYLIYGNDTFKARQKYDALIESLLTRKKDSLAWKLDSENFSEEKFRELIVAQDLFASKYVVGCDNLISNKNIGSFVLENLAALKESANIFIILDGELDDKTINNLKKYAEKDLSFDKKLGEKPKFNIFSLSDALGERNKKNFGFYIWTPCNQIYLQRKFFGSCSG